MSPSLYRTEPRHLSSSHNDSQPPNHCGHRLVHAGRNKVIVCRGVTHAERIMNNSNSATSVMFACSRSDIFLAPQICVDDGQELSLQYGCQFYEVSAAENFAGVSLAFQSLLREARSVQLLKALPIRRKLGVNSVSKVLGNIFGKNSKGDRKKRPSLSI
ncbi:ras-like family member 11 [Holotrichia oblita]|uniref:Ras-like family member 11 n=2 Tax=Holotrichia oblita TaxID=644536 RepID=A0ACB9SYG9_HOLOL|nr:ras-like family member 11 [Holotrichia oblita]KAI4459588.1 ras-like family member 11 [Holotrichia oblita]